MSDPVLLFHAGRQSAKFRFLFYFSSVCFGVAMVGFCWIAFYGADPSLCGQERWILAFRRIGSMVLSICCVVGAGLASGAARSLVPGRSASLADLGADLRYWHCSNLQGSRYWLRSRGASTAPTPAQVSDAQARQNANRPRGRRMTGYFAEATGGRTAKGADSGIHHTDNTADWCMRHAGACDHCRIGTGHRRRRWVVAREPHRADTYGN